MFEYKIWRHFDCAVHENRKQLQRQTPVKLLAPNLMHSGAVAQSYLPESVSESREINQFLTNILQASLSFPLKLKLIIISMITMSHSDDALSSYGSNNLASRRTQTTTRRWMVIRCKVALN